MGNFWLVLICLVVDLWLLVGLAVWPQTVRRVVYWTVVGLGVWSLFW